MQEEFLRGYADSLRNPYGMPLGKGVFILNLYVMTVPPLLRITKTLNKIPKVKDEIL